MPRALRIMSGILFLGSLAALFCCIYLAGITDVGWVKALAIFGATVLTLIAVEGGKQAFYKNHPILMIAWRVKNAERIAKQMFKRRNP